jgi:molybdate transport system substrate-binding protein
MKVLLLHIAGVCLLIGYTTTCKAAEILVFAAASLTEALKDCAMNYEKASGDSVNLSFGGSNDLARQIDAGAPADIFFSADEAKMDFLEEKGRLLSGTRRSLLANSLVIVMYKDAPKKLSDPAQLADESFIHSVALANPAAVPAGIYAKQYLQQINIWDKVRLRIIPTESVRACLAVVASGDADAGIVYKTDTLISKSTVVAYEIPASKTPEISYPLAVLKDSPHPQEARKFEDYLLSPEAGGIFEKHGFIVKK